MKVTLGIEKEVGMEKYLGLPELFGRKKKDLFTAVVDRTKKKAASWSSKFLSCARKMIMIKSPCTDVISLHVVLQTPSVTNLEHSIYINKILVGF